MKNEQQYELVPPNIHIHNAAEKAIQTFKNHFWSGLANCDPEYPVKELDRLLVQCEITLNLLQNSRMNTNLSSLATIQSVYDFNKWPMAPPYTKIIIHAKPEKRGSWAFHGKTR